MPKRIGKICQAENKSSFFDHHGANKPRVTNVGERNWNARLQFKLLDRINQAVEIRRSHLNGNIKIESDAFHTMQNASYSTADHKLDAGISQRHEHFLEVIFHSAATFYSLQTSGSQILP